MPRLTIASRSHDPYWDLDGRGARRSRIQHRVVQWVVRLLIVLVIETTYWYAGLLQAAVARIALEGQN